MHSRSLVPALSVLILIANAPLQTIAAPSTTTTATTRSSSIGQNGQFILSQPQQSVQPQPQSWSLRSVFPQIAWLRDTAVEKVFGVPPKAARPGADKASRPSTQLPDNLLAKHGGDVVLRFNITTPLEEQQLAEAADTLFLDVWEFTSNWADIRLSQDDVCSTCPNLIRISSHI